jgi:hypothetical protein
LTRINASREENATKPGLPACVSGNRLAGRVAADFDLTEKLARKALAINCPLEGRRKRLPSLSSMPSVRQELAATAIGI